MEKVKIALKKITRNVSDWIKKNPTEFSILVLIVIIGVFFRLYKIDQYMVFLGDEGRDAIIVRRIFTELHPPLIGPGTSVGGMYLGPLYYYMMAIPLLVAGFSPVGPAVMIALLGVATIIFIWRIGREWFGKSSGIIAAAIYAISPVVIYYSRSSWNPNIMPFFTLLSIYSVWKVWVKKEFNWLIVLGVSFAFVLQSHYLGLLLLPTLLIFWLIAAVNAKRTKDFKMFITKSFIGLFCFLLLMSPLLIFDIRHNFMNTKAIYTFFVEGRSSAFGNPFLALSRFPVRFNLINNSLLVAKNNLASVIISLIMLATVIYLFFNSYLKRKKLLIQKEYWILFSWIGFGILGLALYKQDVYDHYFEFLFPAPFLLIGIVISSLLTKRLLYKTIGTAFLIYLITVNLLNNPFTKQPNRLMQRSHDVSKLIESNSGAMPFNLAVIADTNYEDGYKYFLLKDNYPVVDIDSQKPGSITSQLFVVCELYPNEKCDPTHSAKAQVANFGWSKISESWSIDGIMVFKLTHTK